VLDREHRSSDIQRHKREKERLERNGFGRFGVHLWRDEFGESAGRRLESRRGDEVYREKIETNGVRGEGDDDDDDDEWWWWWWYEWWWRDDERRLPRRRRRATTTTTTTTTTSDVPGPFLRVQRFYVGRGFQGREVDV